MKTKTRKCIVCGKEYEYCNRCNQNRDTESWKLIYCSENCMDVESVWEMYRANEVTKAEAKSMLADKDLSELNNYRESVKGVIKEIMDIQDKAKETAKIGKILN